MKECTKCSKKSRKYVCESHNDQYAKYDYEYIFSEMDVLNDCKNGVQIILKCRICSEVILDEHYNEHITVITDKFIYKNLDCKKNDKIHGFLIKECGCGKIKTYDTINCDSLYENNNNINAPYYYYNCTGCDYESRIYITDEKNYLNCEVEENIYYRIYCKNKILKEFKHQKYYFDHHYAKYYEFTSTTNSCINGVTVYDRCVNCDYIDYNADVSTFYMHTLTYEEYDVSEFCDCTHGYYTRATCSVCDQYNNDLYSVLITPSLSHGTIINETAGYEELRYSCAMCRMRYVIVNDLSGNITAVKFRVGTEWQETTNTIVINNK